MTLAELLATLRSKGKPGAARVYQKHGVTGVAWGVSYGDLGALVKKIKVDHELALGLWANGVHDARVLATMIADPARMTRPQIDGWIGACDNYVLCGAVATTAARMPDAATLAARWIDHDGEHVSAAGWQVLGSLARDGGLREAEARRLIGAIRAGIHGAKNRTRHSMNGALIAIGGGVPSLREEAIAAAKAIGPVEVDHGETGCKTPDAASYIAKIAAHAEKKTKPAKSSAAKPAKSSAAKPAKKAASAKKAAKR